MSWADEAKAEANKIRYSPDHGPGDCRRCVIDAQVREGFELGAKWQRTQLLTDEAVERVAYAYQAEVKRNRAERLPDLPPETQEAYRDAARKIINALIGEEPRP